MMKTTPAKGNIYMAVVGHRNIIDVLNRGVIILLFLKRIDILSSIPDQLDTKSPCGSFLFLSML